MLEESRRKDSSRINTEIWVNAQDNIDLSKIKIIKDVSEISNFRIANIDNELLNLCVQQLFIPIVFNNGELGLIIDTPFKRLPKVILDEFKSIFITDRELCKKIVNKYFIEHVHALSFNKETKALEAVKTILIKMEKLKASDITISWRSSLVSINYSVNGRNLKDEEDILDIEFAEKLRISLINMSYENQSSKLIDGKFGIRFEDTHKEYRLSVITTVNGFSIVIRSYQKFNIDLTLDNLGYTDKPKQIIRNILDEPYGVFLVTGPTGSGKTTTIYTIINQEFKENNLRIKTAEDPVEIEIDGIDQCQINKKGEEKHQVNYINLLSSFMRQRPDIIVIGEIRDGDVAMSTVEAALTGHKVISTLHTNNVLSSFTRLKSNLGISEDRIEDSFSGILSQRLVDKLCTCRVPHNDGYTANEEGCDICKHNHKIGFDGQIPAVEVAKLFKGENNFLKENFLNYYSYKDSATDLYNLGLIDIVTKAYIETF